MTRASAWVLMNGVLTIPDTGIEIRQNEHPDTPYTLHCPTQIPLPYWTLDNAKLDGEKCANDMAEFK